MAVLSEVVAVEVQRRKEPEGGCGLERKAVGLQAQLPYVESPLESPCLTYKVISGQVPVS